jgi:hypothetical protein
LREHPPTVRLAAIPPRLRRDLPVTADRERRLSDQKNFLQHGPDYPHRARPAQCKLKRAKRL